MPIYNLSLSFHMISVVVFLLFVITVVESNGNSATVNSKSLLEIVSTKITNVDSKVDSLLTASQNKNSKNQLFEPKTESLICSLSSRVIEMENEIDALKSTASLLSANAPSGNTFALISEIRSEVEDLQNSFKKEMSSIKELEQRIQQLDYTSVPEELETQTDPNCPVGNFDIKEYGGKPLFHHLRRISFNVFLRKPSNSSSVANENHNSRYGIDEDFKSNFHTKQESNPWLFVDLEVPHLIWEISLTVHEKKRTAGMKIYLANNVTFDHYGKPYVKTLPVFATQTGIAYSDRVQFTHPGGMCGRFFIVVREVENEYLIIYELQGIGYIFN